MANTRRVWLQIQALIWKNFLTFCKAPISTLLRAFLFPIAITLVWCYLKNTLSRTQYTIPDTGYAASFEPVKSLSDAISATTAEKLAFVRNITNPVDVDPIIDGIFKQPGMEIHAKAKVVFDNPDDLFLGCQQNLNGQSACFAAIIFTNFNATNVDYIVAMDSYQDQSEISFRTHKSVMIERVLPLQWAVESQIGNFTNAPRPVERPFSPDYGVQYYSSPGLGTDDYVSPWIYFIASMVAPLFILAKLGVVYHLSIHVATERQSGMSELLAAQTCSITPRIFSSLLSFTGLYLPGWIACSVLITQILFTRCSTILLVFLSILAGLALTTSSHLVASFFRKAQLAGLYTSVLFFALAFVPIAFTLTIYPDFNAIQALSVLFPPFTYVFLIGDIARAEGQAQSFSLKRTYIVSGNPPYPAVDGYLYIIFFVIQIFLYTIATFLVERYLWGVKRTFEKIPVDSSIALRLTSLSKTFNGRRRWYWPFTSGKPLKAVDSLDLELKKGSISFLLGPNGGGKSTTLKCMAGMISMDPGSKLEINEGGMSFGICPQGNVSVNWPHESMFLTYFSHCGTN